MHKAARQRNIVRNLHCTAR